MIFNILSSKTSMSRWQDQSTGVSITYEVVPRGRDYLEIGEGYILAAAGYLPLRDEKRQPVVCSVTILSDPSRIAQRTSEVPTCGQATFYPERDGDLDSDPAQLFIILVIEPERFAELLNLRITRPGSATLHAKIEGLEFGWEPDGSHQIWKLPEKVEKYHREVKHIDSFWIGVETFWASEGSIGKSEDERQNTLSSESPDEQDRLRAVDQSPSAASDASIQVLRHIRTLLLVLIIVLVLMLLRHR
jgi:hypothetical protein